MKKYLLNNCVKNGYITKFIGTDLVDSSLLWFFTSFKLLWDGDEYYGGGEWPLLTSFLSWVYVILGRLKDAEKMLNNDTNLLTKTIYFQNKCQLI